jgi:hypothetical protein
MSGSTGGNKPPYYTPAMEAMFYATRDGNVEELIALIATARPADTSSTPPTGAGPTPTAVSGKKQAHAGAIAVPSPTVVESDASDNDDTDHGHDDVVELPTLKSLCGYAPAFSEDGGVGKKKCPVCQTCVAATNLSRHVRQQHPESFAAEGPEGGIATPSAMDPPCTPSAFAAGGAVGASAAGSPVTPMGRLLPDLSQAASPLAAVPAWKLQVAASAGKGATALGQHAARIAADTEAMASLGKRRDSSSLVAIPFDMYTGEGLQPASLLAYYKRRITTNSPKNEQQALTRLIKALIWIGNTLGMTTQQALDNAPWTLVDTDVAAFLAHVHGDLKMQKVPNPPRWFLLVYIVCSSVPCCLLIVVNSARTGLSQSRCTSSMRSTSTPRPTTANWQLST